MTKLNIEEILVSVQNSAGWVFAQSNTIAGGSLVSINNSAGWVMSIANTAGMGINVQNSAGWTVGVGSTSIVNSAGWIVNVANTNGMTINVINSAGWVVSVANTALWNIAVGSTSIVNSAGWAVYALDSAAVGAITTSVASTIGTVVLLASNTKRVGASIYNASANPMYMKMGSGAKSTDFTLMMVSSGFYELSRPIYNGQITGVWPTADGNAYMTETT